MTKTKLTKVITRLNDLLASELGRNPYGTGHYKWQFSEDLWHPMAQIEAVDGEWKPVLDYVAQPNGLIVAQQKFVLRKECPTLDNQWVLCKWQPPMDPSQWRQIFGHSLQWPGTQDYAPIGASGSGNYASLDIGEVPTEKTTWQAIQTIRANRAISTAERDAQVAAESAKREQSIADTVRAEVAEMGTIAGRPWLRGKGNQDYSFGGTGKVN